MMIKVMSKKERACVCALLAETTMNRSLQSVGVSVCVLEELLR